MGDQFEKFIQENRSAFDQETDAERIWKGIEKGIDRPSTQWGWVWKAAAVFFLLSTSVLLVDRLRMEVSTPEMAEFQRVEAYYSNLIEVKRSEIIAHSNRELVTEFLQEIDQLDKMYADLKGTFRKKTTDQKLTDAMIANLQLRLNILEQQLKILEQLNQKKNEESRNIEI